MIHVILRSQSRKFWKGGSWSQKFWKGRCWKFGKVEHFTFNSVTLLPMNAKRKLQFVEITSSSLNWCHCLNQGWVAYLLSQAAWIVDYCWWATNKNWLYPKILPLSYWGMEASYYILPKYMLIMELRSDVILYFNWVMKIMMRAISNAHVGRRFPLPGLTAGLC